MSENENKSAIFIGIKSGLISSLCCVTPMLLVILLMFGIGSTSLLIGSLALAQYKSWFILFGLTFMSISIYLYLKRQNKGVCNINTIKANKALIITTFVVYLIMIITTLYVVLPLMLNFT